MSNYLTTDTELTYIANAIRTAGGTSASLIYPSQFISAIYRIYPSLENFTINESALYSQSITFNVQQGYLINSYKNTHAGNDLNIDIVAQNIVLNDKYHINGTINVTQGSNSESITLNTDFIMSTVAAPINFTYTGSDLAAIKIQYYSSTYYKIIVDRKDTSNSITAEVDIELLKYGKGFSNINLNLIDNPWALTTYKSMALNSVPFWASDTAVQSTFNTYTSISSGAFAFRRFNTTSNNSVYYFNNVTNIDKFAFYAISTNAIYKPIFSFPEVTLINDSAFYSAYALGEIYAPKCSLIYPYAFYSCNNLSEANFPSVEHVGSNAFYNCRKLTTASFPKCTSLNTHVFYCCSSLNNISFPSCTYIGFYTFYSCSGLTEVNFPEASHIGSSCFFGCNNLTSASFPKCTDIFYAAFQNCSKLQDINFPLVINISSYAFANCQSLTSISFSNCLSLPNSVFYMCKSLQWASFPKCTQISAQAFYGCSKLESLYLLGSSVATLGNSVFNFTPMIASSYLSPSRYGSIYVPSSLLTTYKTATNWTAYSSRIVGV